jgi:hypothetical protein
MNIGLIELGKKNKKPTQKNQKNKTKVRKKWNISKK